MITFVGLGNPGSHYAATKHNAGFWVVDELAHRRGLTFHPGRGDYLYAQAEQLLLAKPTTGMNASGRALKTILSQWEVDSEDLYIIVDDVDLPLGRLRLRPHGGDGCHRGLESVIYHLRTERFPRLRLGVATSEATRPAEDFVLKPFLKAHRPLAMQMVQTAADALETVLEKGLEPAMTEYNRLERVEANL